MATNTYAAIGSAVVSGSAATSIVVNSIPATYTDLQVVIATSGISVADTIKVYFNNDTTALYSMRQLTGQNGGTIINNTNSNQSIIYGIGSYNSGNTTGVSSILMDINNYSSTTQNKTLIARDNNNPLSADLTVGAYRSTNAISSMTFTIQGGHSFSVGSRVDVYGILAEPATGTGSKAIGGTVTTSGGYTYHTFTSTNMFQPTASITGAEILLVAGGGAGGNNYSGGGGAGGLVYLSSQSFSSGTNVPVIVGAGGSSATQGTNSLIGSSTVAIGGGFGASGASSATGGTGGSGGGGGANAGAAGSATAGQGNAGGAGSSGGNGERGGSGGGAGAAGVAAESATGGNGLSTYSAWGAATSTGQNISGTYWYAGGGGAGSWNRAVGTGGNGGGGGPTAGGTLSDAGDAFTGGGGSGVSQGGTGGAGGSGVVIVRYTT
jgi:hypothetical protein